MQTTLLGLAIAFIIALIAALVGRISSTGTGFGCTEYEASRNTAPGARRWRARRARLLPTPSLRLRSAVVAAPTIPARSGPTSSTSNSARSLDARRGPRHRADDQRHVARSRPRS